MGVGRWVGRADISFASFPGPASSHECGVVERRLGALPASAEFLRRLDVAGIIDELCPVRDVAHLTHGHVIEVLVANRLSSPTSMVRVGNWARTWAVEEVFGVEPELLNDDRLARALDAVAPHLEEITGSIGCEAAPLLR